jgi:hypothetical protein
MLLHIRPKLLCPFRDCAIVDLTIEPFGLTLRGDRELRTGHPYPNKRYFVASRRSTRKALDGILIETPEHVPAYRYTARWSIAAQLLITHHVSCEVLDRDFDVASEDSTLWLAYYDSLGGWRSRDPSGGWGKRQSEPLMEFLPGENGPWPSDAINERGWIIERRDVLKMPTIERERFLTTGNFLGRKPTPETAFRLHAPGRGDPQSPHLLR